MTVRDLKKLVKAIPREYNNFEIISNMEELIALVTYPILSEHFDEAFNIELVTTAPCERKRVAKKNTSSNEAKI